MNPAARERPASRPRTWLLWADAALVGLVTLVTFLPCLFADFLNWDDDGNFLHNLAYRGLGWRQISWMFTTFQMGYVPLTWLTLGADYVVWGMRPLGYHLSSLLFHALNAALVALVAGRLLRLGLPDAVGAPALRVGSAAAALLFAVHPLRVESVAWISERRDVLSGLFYLLALLAYLRASEPEPGAPDRRRRWYWASVGLFALALLSKAIAVTLPVILLVLDVYPLRRLGGAAGWSGPAARRVVLEKVPFFALALGMAIVALRVVLPQETTLGLGAFGVGDRLAVALHGLTFYLQKTLVPLRLSPLYELLVPLRTPVNAAIVLALTAAALLAIRRWPALPAAWAAYVITALPVLGLVQSGPYIAADRYTYLACLSWAILFGAGLAWAAQGWFAGAPARYLHAGALGIGTLALVALAGLSARQTLVWQDSLTLWSYVVEVSPKSVLARTGLAGTLLAEGQVEAADRHLAEAVRLAPAFDKARMGLALTRSIRGLEGEALAHARQVVGRNPDHAGYRATLAEILRAAGRSEEALAEMREAARLDPRAFRIRYVMAATLVQMGRAREALAPLEEGRRLAREAGVDDLEGLRYAALVYARLDPPRAIAALDQFLDSMRRLPRPTPGQRSQILQAQAELDALRRQQRGSGLEIRQ